MINLIVSGENPEHLNSNLQTLLKLKKRGISIGSVVIIGEPKPEVQNLQPQNAKNQNIKIQKSLVNRRVINNLELTQPSLENASALVKKYKIENSPTWIVKYQGKEYVFEGLRSAQQLFSSTSVFRGKDYSRTKGQIAHHSKNRSSQKFTLKKKLSKDPTVPKVLRNVTMSNPAYVYNLNTGNSLKFGAYDGLPKCKKNTSRFIFRSGDEQNFRNLDIIVYQFNSTVDYKKAKKIKTKAIPYIEGDLSNPHRDKSSKTQIIIRALGIECLPTRVKSIVKDGRPAFEYLEGSKAWQTK